MTTGKTTDETQKRRRPGLGKRPGLGRQLGKTKKEPKEDSSVTLGKFMKSKVDALNESVKAGGMKRDRILEGSTMRSPKRFVEDVEAGKYKKPNKDAAYYKSIGLTGERGDKAVKDFFKPQKLAKGGSAKKKKRGAAIKGRSKILR